MNVPAYLHRTARNVLWNQRRDAHEVLVDDLETTVGADDQLERDPERAALLVEQRRLVRRCATLLTRRQRRALTLRDVDGHSYAEIGSELGIGADAVAQVISRARMRLRSVVRREQVALDELSPECRAMLGPVGLRRRSRLLERAGARGAPRRLRTLPPHARLLSGSRPATSRRRAAGAARRSARPPRRAGPRRRRRSPRHRDRRIARDRRRRPSVAAACSLRSD